MISSKSNNRNSLNDKYNRIFYFCIIDHNDQISISNKMAFNII